jgi:hypothetical protein
MILKYFRIALPAIMILFSLDGFSQLTMDSIMRHPEMFPQYNPVKSSDKYRANAVPVFSMSPDRIMLKSTLPSFVDNSTLMYERPATTQEGYECGQSASISHGYTYEVNFLRNLSAMLSTDLANQYPSHFVWDFFNGGDLYGGVSMFDTWEIMRKCGTPNVQEYGGSLSWGSYKRWISGYSTYLSAMHNRIEEIYRIPVDTPEGILLLKQWIYDHCNGSAHGGVAQFYMAFGSPNATLPTGTPESGKTVYTTLGSYINHTWTIVGYNDSIRYDFNGDGKYTMTIDINNDGVVNMRDWEKGGIKINNCYSGSGWGNGSYSYIMYRALLDYDGIDGGIWNQSCYIVKAKEDLHPKLTYKIRLNHDIRNMVKIVAGMSTYTSATKPEYYIDFPIVSYQGGAFYMQGGTTTADKTFEYGLDVTPFLSYINSGQTVKFFLDVYEKDPSGTGTGAIQYFSLFDYNGTTTETVGQSTTVPMNNNDTTRFSIIKTVTFDKVQITSDSLPAANLYTPYSYQLQAANGATPYHWELKFNYAETSAADAFPTANTTQLSFVSVGNGDYYAEQNLSFDFPFYDKKFNKVVVGRNGYLKFDSQLWTRHFQIDNRLVFRENKVIAPFIAALDISGSGNGVWYSGDANSATFRWKATVSGSAVNFAAKLYPSGLIEFYYGNMSFPAGTVWFGGVSRGDNMNYNFTKFCGQLAGNTTPIKSTFTTSPFPIGFSLSESGLFTGTPYEQIANSDITFMVTDNDNIISLKTLAFSTKGVLVSYKIHAGGDSIINAGENVILDVKVKNTSTVNLSNADMKIFISDSLIGLTDSLEHIGNLNIGDSVTFSNAFAFSVDNATIDGHIIDVRSQIYSAPADTFFNDHKFTVNSFILIKQAEQLLDGNNNELEPDETATLKIDISNIGGSPATNVIGKISTGDPFIDISASIANVNTINSGQTKSMFFIIHASPVIPTPRIVIIDLLVTAGSGYTMHNYVTLNIGQTGETFETGDFTLYPWHQGGDVPWYVQDTIFYGGSEAAKSGNIADNQESTLFIVQSVIADGPIKFYKKVSCEADANNHNYDYMAFFIDNVEKERWDGVIDWSPESYPVSTGNHTFKWVYHKDYSVSTGGDCAWLDNIIFPISGDSTPSLNALPNPIFKAIGQNSIDTSHIAISNTGTGMVFFNNSVSYIGSGSNYSWLQPDYYNGCIINGESNNLKLTFNATGLALGTYDATLTLDANSINQINIPVTMEVNSYIGIEENNPDFNIGFSPNPFKSSCKLTINAKNKLTVSIDVYNTSGQIVSSLLKNEKMSAGSSVILWDGKTSTGKELPVGVYYCKIGYDGAVETIKLVKIK